MSYKNITKFFPPKSSLYIRKIIALIIISVLTLATYKFINWKYLIPFSLFSFSFLHSRLTGIKPEHLYILADPKKKYRPKETTPIPFKWLLNLGGLINDIIIMTVNGIYLIFSIYIDILTLIKRIIYFIFSSLIWFISLFIPPFEIIFRNTIHYLIKWPWMIYTLALNNVKPSINRNFYYLSYCGAFLFLFVLFLFIGLGVILNIPALIIPGIILSSLPLVWTFSNIAFIRHNALTEKEFKFHDIPKHLGSYTIKALLFFLILALIMIIIEILLNIPGWIPDAGISLLGISISLNSILTLFLMFIGVILLFANIILPAHVVINPKFKPWISDSIEFIGVIAGKFLRYLFSFIPISIFSFFLSIIPVLIVAISLFFTLNLRNNIIDRKIYQLQEKVKISLPEKSSKINKNILLLEHYKNFPLNIMEDFEGVKSLKSKQKHLKSNLLANQLKLAQMEKEYHTEIDSLTNIVNALKASETDQIQQKEIQKHENIIEHKTKTFKAWKLVQTKQITNIEGEIFFIRSLLIQLPLLCFFTILWLSVIGALILAVLLSYLANVFYKLYLFREDGRVSHFTQSVREIHKKDPKQPLLGITLIILALISIFIFNYFHPIF